MSDESVLEETWNILRSILGLQKKKTRVPKPPPLKPMGIDEMDQLGAMHQNYLVNQQLTLPGAMVLDTPLSRARSEKQMMEDFEESGVPQRPHTGVRESDLPRGTLTSRAIGTKR